MEKITVHLWLPFPCLLLCLLCMISVWPTGLGFFLSLIHWVCGWVYCFAFISCLQAITLYLLTQSCRTEGWSWISFFSSQCSDALERKIGRAKCLSRRKNETNIVDQDFWNWLGILGVLTWGIWFDKDSQTGLSSLTAKITIVFWWSQVS